MKKVVIANESIQAVILPDFGGAVSELKVEGAEVLRMNYGMLGMSSVLAGGIPVLFPFVSRTRDDEAVFLGESYTMPMHGFAKDMPFELTRCWDCGCEVTLESCAITRRFYPYDFRLRIVYECVESSLRTTMHVENTGNVDLPFAAGYHPFFLVRDGDRTSFSFGLKEYWDYLRMDADGKPTPGTLEGGVDLADSYDTVFFSGNADSEIVNHDLGWRARLECGDTFDVITICTSLENAACVEPWQARPGAAHDPEACQVVKPGTAKSYIYSIQLEKL